MKIFSVTQVLTPWFNSDKIPNHILEHAIIRGTQVHTACATYASGLWVGSMPESASPYFISFRRWFDKNAESVLYVEKEFIDEQIGFVGHPDLVAGFDSKCFVIDLKTPLIESKTWKCQLAAYRHLVSREIKDREVHVMSLQLSNNGGIAKANVYENSDADFAIFLSALNCYRYFRS